MLARHHFAESLRLPSARKLFGRGSKVVTLLGAVLIGVIGIYDIVNISSHSDELFSASIGVGIMITTVGGFGLLAAFWVARSEKS